MPGPSQTPRTYLWRGALLGTAVGLPPALAVLLGFGLNWVPLGGRPFSPGGLLAAGAIWLIAAALGVSWQKAKGGPPSP